MRIFIDADSCPVMVRDHVVSFSKLKKIQVIFVANHLVLIESNADLKMIVCPEEKDAADNYIFENCVGASEENSLCADEKLGYISSDFFETACDLVRSGSDLVITKDILFASRLVEKRVACINDRGIEFTKKNIGKLLKERDEDLMYVSMGLVKHNKGSGYNKKEFALFANSFDKILSEIN